MQRAGARPGPARHGRSLMRDVRELRLEFRIPISPNPGFFAQVRAFDFALRRLGRPYSTACLTVFVGDNCDIEAVRAANTWSGDRVHWRDVPRAIFDEFGIHGTADWRWVPQAKDVDLVLLSDADTVLLRDIDPLLLSFPLDRAAVRGHMAHLPPPSDGHALPSSDSVEYWPTLFGRFGAPWPDQLFSYSMDEGGRLPQAPAYFNLGFLACSPAALTIVGHQIFQLQRELMAALESYMRCQIAVCILSYKNGFDVGTLPAQYNAANDSLHMRNNYISDDDIRVLHYLRSDEIDRSRIFQASHIDEFLNMELENRANRRLQALALDYKTVVIGG
jgi:hypothetical protein